LAIFGIFLALVAGMSVQYWLYRRIVSKGRQWHPQRQAKKAFWL
jgi:hypothetical protein